MHAQTHTQKTTDQPGPKFWELLANIGTVRLQHWTFQPTLIGNSCWLNTYIHKHTMLTQKKTVPYHICHGSGFPNSTLCVWVFFVIVGTVRRVMPVWKERHPRGLCRYRLIWINEWMEGKNEKRNKSRSWYLVFNIDFIPKVSIKFQQQIILMSAWKIWTVMSNRYIFIVCNGKLMGTKNGGEFPNILLQW